MMNSTRTRIDIADYINVRRRYMEVVYDLPDYPSQNASVALLAQIVSLINKGYSVDMIEYQVDCEISDMEAEISKALSEYE